jgi:lipopolysaccharide biosynthesis glycosyltransferase
MIIKKQQKQKVEREGKRAGVLLFNIQSFWGRQLFRSALLTPPAINHSRFPHEPSSYLTMSFNRTSTWLPTSNEYDARVTRWAQFLWSSPRSSFKEHFVFISLFILRMHFGNLLKKIHFH